MEFRLKDGIELTELEKYGFHTFRDFNNLLRAVRDSTNDSCGIGQYFRIGIVEYNRTFSKSKYRGGGKCLLTMNVTKNDILDLIQADLIEKVKH